MRIFFFLSQQFFPCRNVRGKRVKKKLEQARQLVVPEVTITEASGSENDKPGNREST